MNQPVDPIRPTDDEGLRLAERLLRGARRGALGTLESGGHPFVSLVSLATDVDGTPLILVSRLSHHTAHLSGDARCSLLVDESGKGDPLAHPRLTLTCRAVPIDRESERGLRVRRRFLARQPKAALYVDFPDFGFFALEIERGSLNGGFGKAYRLERGDLVLDLAGAEDLVAVEESAVEHMNADHADSASLFAERLLGLPAGRWTITGIDPSGCDLASSERTGRLPFGERVTSPDGLRRVLHALSVRARSQSDGTDSND
jgi:putative heme iron utilization protein